MERKAFKQRLKQYKKAREENPELKYWEWKNIPKYDEGVESITRDPEELKRNIQKVLHTTPEGEINTFYNSIDDTYGTVELPDVVVTAPYTRKASLAQQARRGAQAYYDAGKKAAPVLATIPFGAAGLAAVSTLGINAVSDLISLASDPLDPTNYVPFYNELKKVGQFIDTGFMPSSKLLTQTDNTLTRYVGTEDSGYKDALTSGVIRGNMTPTRFNVHELKIMNKKLSAKLSEEDLRALNSNNITEENFDRINAALKSISSNVSQGKINLGKNYSLGNTYQDYLTGIQKDQNRFKLIVGNWGLNRSPEINDWISNWNGHNLATFARETEILDNKLLFPGDYAVKISNADKWERTATHLGHLPEHKITFRPVEYDNPDVTWYKRKDGLFSKKKYMVEVPKSQVEKDWIYYNKDSYAL